MKDTLLPFKMDRKSLAASAIVMIVALVVLVAVRNGHSPARVTYSQFLNQVQTGQVASVAISAEATVHLKDGSAEPTALPAEGRGIISILLEKHVDIDTQQPLSLSSALANSTPFLLLLGLWAFMMARLRTWRAG